MDTISFRINLIPSFNILDRAQFVPEFSGRTFNDLSAKERVRCANPKNRYVRRFILHPDNKDGLYLPQVELYEKGNFSECKLVYEAVITFSAPKLIFENNLQEISALDGEQIFEILIARLYEVGIRVSAQSIVGAPLSVVHFCKNIPLPREISLRGILAELSKVDMGRAFDTTDDLRRTDKNNSKVVHFYSGTREWVFYDKIEDLRKTKGKRMDKQRTEYEKDMPSLLGIDGTEVFRFEYRLSKAQTIRSEINSLFGKNFRDLVTFGEIFKDGLYKEIICNAWGRVLARPENQLALLDTNDTLTLLLHTLDEACKHDTGAHSQNKALWSYGLAIAIKQHGAKTIRQELERRWPAKSGERINDKLEIAHSLMKDIPLSQGITFVSKELQLFTPISIDILRKNATEQRPETSLKNNHKSV